MFDLQNLQLKIISGDYTLWITWILEPSMSPREIQKKNLYYCKSWWTYRGDGEDFGVDRHVKKIPIALLNTHELHVILCGLKAMKAMIYELFVLKWNSRHQDMLTFWDDEFFEVAAFLPDDNIFITPSVREYQFQHCHWTGCSWT